MPFGLRTRAIGIEPGPSADLLDFVEFDRDEAAREKTPAIASPALRRKLFRVVVFPRCIG
jgi:hypothetical protein